MVSISRRGTGPGLDHGARLLDRSVGDFALRSGRSRSVRLRHICAVRGRARRNGLGIPMPGLGVCLRRVVGFPPPAIESEHVVHWDRCHENEKIAERGYGVAQGVERYGVRLDDGSNNVEENGLCSLHA